MSENKVIRKRVKIKQFELTQKRVEESRYNKFQLWVSKRLKLDLIENHQYLYRIQYYGSTRLKVDDIVVNSQGIIFVVVKEANRLAMIVSKDSLPGKPNMYGSLTIIDK